MALLTSRRTEPRLGRAGGGALWGSAGLLACVALVGLGLGLSACGGEAGGCTDDAQCPEGTACRDGTCVELCEGDDDCTRREQRCIDGVCVTVVDTECDGTGTEVCDDDNPCTLEDRCTASGACVGQPKVCEAPPEPECVEEDTVYRTYPPVGACDPDTGDCVYDPIDTACPDCTDVCLLPCEALVCDDTHDGCRVGLCDPGPPAVCDYTNVEDGTDCTVGGTGAAGTCEQGVCECAPLCSGRDCGPDGCGGSCGSCEDGTVCRTLDGQCVIDCTPDCTGRVCGDDGCEGSCGTCEADDCLVCNTSGACVSACVGNQVCVAGDCCTPSCPDCRTSPVADGCGGTCALNCASPSVCYDNVCCAPSCDPCRESTVSDGCGGTCAANCLADDVCVGDDCCTPSCPDCRASSVADGCGGTCAANCTGDDQCCGDTCTPPPTSCPSGYTDCGYWCTDCEYLYDDDPTCPTDTLTAVCGDEGADERTITGWSEAFVEVTVNECNSLGVAPRVTFTLTMPSCADFDFHVYRDDCEGDEEVSCAGGGTTERKCISWTDFPAVNNSRDYVVEIRAFYETATCCGEWELLVEGFACWTATSGCTPD